MGTMPKNNARLRWTIIGFCLTTFVVLIGWGSSFVTSKVNNAKAEQEVEDTVQSHTYWIQELEKDVEDIKNDTSAIKTILGRYDERLKGLEKSYDKIDGKLDDIWRKVK